MSRAWLIPLVLLCGCAPPACADADERAMESEVELLVRDDGDLGQRAADALAARGEDAIVHLEAGLYRAAPRARVRIVKTLARIGSDEAAPIFAHLARKDPDPDVREAAERALNSLK